MTKYEEYQLRWMIDHGISIDDLMNNMQCVWEMLHAEKEENEVINVTTAYEVWHDSFGFNNELWTSRDEWLENESLDENQLKIRILNGMLVATPSSDPDYPGIDIEYVDDHDLGDALSRSRVLIESPTSEKSEQELRCLIWNDPLSEDYSDEISLKTYNKTEEFMKCLSEIQEAINKGIIKHDPKNKDNILVWMKPDEEHAPHWCSQSIIEAANELLDDKIDYVEFKKSLAQEEAEKGE